MSSIDLEQGSCSPDPQAMTWDDGVVLPLSSLRPDTRAAALGEPRRRRSGHRIYRPPSRGGCVASAGDPAGPPTSRSGPSRSPEPPTLTLATSRTLRPARELAALAAARASALDLSP